MDIEEEQLKEFILDASIISEEEYEDAEKEAEEKESDVGDMLVRRGQMREEELRRIQAHVLGVSFVDLKGRSLDFEILSLIPEPVARNHNVIAFGREGGVLEVALLDLRDLEAISFIKKENGLKIRPRLTDSESIKHALLRYQRSLKDEFGETIQKESSADDPSAVRIVDTLLKHAILQDASNIHIEPMREKAIVRYRIDGVLHDAMTLPKHIISPITARIATLAGLEEQLPQNGRCTIEFEEQDVSCHVSILPTQQGEKLVLRLSRQHAPDFSLEELGFHGESLEHVYQTTREASGLILAAGPPESGKTTTLYTLLSILNSPRVSISTLEDPVERQIKRVNQTQVNADTGLDFSNGLRSLLRQDPDIVMVGGMPDAETANLAVNAALSGRLLLSELQADSAADGISQLLDMGAKPHLLASALKVVISQWLVRALGNEREGYKLSDDTLGELDVVADLDSVLEALKREAVVPEDAGWKDISFYRPTEDNEDGYDGQVGIQEVLQVTPTIQELIKKEASDDEIEQQARSEGMMTMAEDSIFKAAQGITTIEEVLRIISD